MSSLPRWGASDSWASRAGRRGRRGPGQRCQRDHARGNLCWLWFYGHHCQGHNAVGCIPIFEFGTDDQKERYLKPFARGEN
ncbi:MAG: hypothetical protein Ct9H300mP13_4460 [Gammaproteobacteria bacterium]|nr:MAG: hypothetical protein Ct9H300mP13_4460 [Gammaproteobacteria bacterium]